MKSFKTLSAVLVLAVMVAACGLIGESPNDTFPGVTSTTLPRSCIQITTGAAPIDTGSRATDAISLSGEIFRCAREVVVVDDADLNGVLAAAQLAAAVNGPLLFLHPQLPAEIGRLEPTTLHVIGDLDVLAPPDTTIETHTVATALELAGQKLGTSNTVAIPSRPDATSIVETVKAITDGDRIAVPGGPNAAAAQPSISNAEIIGGIAGINGDGPVWLVDASDPVTILMTSALTHAVGAAVVAADLNDLFRHPEVGPALSGYPERSIRLIGTSAVLDDWKLRTLVNARQIPGGGFEVFPDHIPRRFLAFYGHPRSETLGAMGQVTPQQALTMMRDGGTLTGYPDNARCLPSPCRGTVPGGLLDAYGADGAHVVPTFNYIGSVAHPRCRSSLTPLDAFEEGIEVAGANDGYVVFDLQPGSARFIEHARFFEEYLRLPYVGLAIDPEWRCGWPDQTEFNRAGTVTAAEINEVIEWLADLVNEVGLPQKLLIIQQFRLDMIQDRDQLLERPEVQVVIQMDGEGQGNLTVKDNTWRGVTRGTEDMHWRWGWKQFFVRDSPNGPYPAADVLDREPVPVYISYQ